MRRQILVSKVLPGIALAMAVCGLAADGTVAADATPDEPAPVEVSGTEHWSLRSDRAVPMTPRSKIVPISEMPNERRSVRMVYYGYGEANLIKEPH